MNPNRFNRKDGILKPMLDFTLYHGMGDTFIPGWDLVTWDSVIGCQSLGFSLWDSVIGI